MISVRVVETFISIQGESTWAGLSCFFIRLAGCNLRCSYCDTPGAQVPGAGRSIAIDTLVARAAAGGTAIVEITGGEPLLQPGCAVLARRLCNKLRKPVLVETNGSLDISVLPKAAIAIMDVKCPSSGMADKFDAGNIARLRPRDEVKFVIANSSDYSFARGFAVKHKLVERCNAVLFSPVSGKMDPKRLAGWIQRDRLEVRLQLQLHKTIGAR